MIDWTHWHNEPYLVGGLIFLGWLYAILTGPWRDRLAGPDEPYPRRHAARFYSALVIFYLAVGSPLDQAGERFLLSAHMLQHQLIIYPSAVLFLLGLPAWLVDAALSYAPLGGIIRLLTRPMICGIIYCLGIQIWHFPDLYDWALQNRFIHILEHFTFFGVALFFWWPTCSPSKAFPPASYAVQMFYYVGITIGMTPVFAYITFAQDVLYPTYEFAPRISSLTAASDQLLAGSMMKLVGMIVMMISFGVSFCRWYQASENASPKTKPAKTG